MAVGVSVEEDAAGLLRYVRAHKDDLALAAIVSALTAADQGGYAEARRRLGITTAEDGHRAYLSVSYGYEEWELGCTCGGLTIDLNEWTQIQPNQDRRLSTGTIAELVADHLQEVGI